MSIVLVGILLAAGIAAVLEWRWPGKVRWFLDKFATLRRYAFAVMWLVLAVIFLQYGGTPALIGWCILLIAFLYGFTSYDVVDTLRGYIPFL